jgi:antitoxin component of RelBE/YafQ-DinJ toxin-antitoxin module
MKREKHLVETLTIRITKELLENYKNFCDENGLSFSKRLRFFMEKDISGKVKFDK